MTTLRVARPALALAAALMLASLVGCSASGSDFVGAWGKSTPGQPSLTIKADGTFSGNDGCNDMKGKGTISGDTFTFGPFASTLKACEGVRPWLNLANTAKVDGDTLTVYKTNGDKIGTLTKQ